MKELLFTAFVLIFCFTLKAQTASPCKVIKKGMKQSDVLKLCGNPDERDTLGHDKNMPDAPLIEWHYGKPKAENNQRVQFSGDVVTSVVASGKKYEELIARLLSGDLKSADLEKEIDQMNAENCK